QSDQLQLLGQRRALYVLQIFLIAYIIFLVLHCVRYVIILSKSVIDEVGGIFVLISIALLGCALALTYRMRYVIMKKQSAVTSPAPGWAPKLAPAPAPATIEADPAACPRLPGDAGAPYPYSAANPVPFNDGFQAIPPN
ncbi:hypothetical protein PFISCL1PPCAC_23223, partial [Pristionchus fissidentatus]